MDRYRNNLHVGDIQSYNLQIQRLQFLHKKAVNNSRSMVDTTNNFVYLI